MGFFASGSKTAVPGSGSDTPLTSTRPSERDSEIFVVRLKPETWRTGRKTLVLGLRWSYCSISSAAMSGVESQERLLGMHAQFFSVGMHCGRVGSKGKRNVPGDSSG